jgi:hypothetical protein
MNVDGRWLAWAGMLDFTPSEPRTADGGKCDSRLQDYA